MEVTEDEMVGCISNSIDKNLSKLQELMKDRDLCSPMNWHAAVHNVAQSDTT